MVEKPLVFDLGEARTLSDAADRRGLFFAINFNHRYARPMQMARQAIEDGLLGDVVFVTWRFGGEGNSDHHPYANLIETQCHGLDTLEHLCGPIESVMAQMTDKTGGGYGTLVLALRFADGAVGSLTGTYDSSYAFPQTHTLEIGGTLGRVRVEDTVRRFAFQAIGDETARVWQAGYFNDQDREFHRTFDRHVDEMLQAFRPGNKPPVHARRRVPRARARLGGDRIVRDRQARNGRIGSKRRRQIPDAVWSGDTPSRSYGSRSIDARSVSVHAW